MKGVLAGLLSKTRRIAMPDAEIIVVGAGPVGLGASVTMAHLGFETMCLAPAFDPELSKADTRTTALFQASVQLLKNIGVWRVCIQQAAALAKLRMVDDTGRLLRAPELLFRAAELGHEAFGYNIANAHLIAGLLGAFDQHTSKLAREETSGVAQVQTDRGEARLYTQEGRQYRAKLVVGADGRKSLCRSVVGSHVKEWTYEQCAIATWFAHTLSHDNTSTEFHRRAGPLTTVPLPGNVSSLVWVERPDETQRLMQLDDGEFADTLDSQICGFLGSIRMEAPRAAFPLKAQLVSPIAGSRVALVGEAAHVIPPIGAQGLNLGFRDIAGLADCLSDGQGHRDPGSSSILSAYRADRRLDVTSRTFAVDILNKSLISDFLPASMARGLGLHAMAAIPALKRAMMREGMQPSNHVPTLMRQGQATTGAP